MTAIPADSYLSNTGRTTAQMQQAFEDISSVLMELIGGTSEGSVTLASDAHTPAVDKAVYNLSPESSTTDDFSTITNTNTREGQVLAYRNNNSANTITVKHGTGNIYLADGADYAMNATGDYLFLMRRSTNWYECGRVERNKINALAGAQAESSVTVASGLIIPTRFAHKVAGEGSASDNLDGAASTFLGNMLVLRTADASDVITVRHNQSVSAGYYPFYTYDGNSITLDSLVKFVLFIKDTSGGYWREIARGGFSAGSGAWTQNSVSGAFNITGGANTSYIMDTSAGAATATFQTSPADGRRHSLWCTSASYNATVQTTGGEYFYFANGSTATSFTLKSIDGAPEFEAVTGGYKEV